MIRFTLAVLSSLSLGMGSLTLAVAAPQAGPHIQIQSRNPNPNPNPSPNKASSESSCTREILKSHTETLLKAQTIGDPSPLIALQSQSSSPNYNSEFIYTQDFKPSTLNSKTSILTTPLKIDHSRSLLDTTQCATYTEIISTSPNNGHVIGTQMRFDPTANKLLKIETLVTQQGDWLFNATSTLHYAIQEDPLWTPIPESEQDTRSIIQAAGDAYLDVFNNKSVSVPWGTPCQRLEGGAYTGRGLPSDSCNVGIPSGVPITNRRYVIDEVLGAVDAFVSFASRPDSHEFRVEKGKLRLVHTLTVMRN